MAELADALDSGSSEDFLHAGSSPVSRTKQETARNGRFLAVTRYLYRFQRFIFITFQPAVSVLCHIFKNKYDTRYDTEFNCQSAK